MKPSNYNFIYNWAADEPLVVYNSLFSRTIELEKRWIHMLDPGLARDEYERLDEKGRNVADELYKQHFLIDDFIDELKIIKYRNESGRYLADTLSLTIAPTLSCNFSCYYCYEKKESSPMSVEVQDALISFAALETKKKKQLSVSWYGGEPLLEKDIIEDMSAKLIGIASENNCSYKASIVTNGYLLDEAFARKLKDLKITTIQITLDGPPAVHDRRRFLKASHSGTFDTIIANMKTTKQICSELEHDIQIILRVNIDLSNEDTRNTSALFDILQQHGLKDLYVYPAQVNSQGAFKQAAASCVKTPEFSMLEIEIIRDLAKRSFATTLHYSLPEAKRNYCGGDSISSFSIDPEGWMYKCWVNIGDLGKACGNICRENIPPGISSRLEMNMISWMTCDPFDSEECVNCRMLPICMGGCPYHAVYKDEGMRRCESIRYSLEAVIKRYYNAQKFAGMLSSVATKY